MYPDNETLAIVGRGIVDFLGSRIYAILIFACLFGWAWHLHREFLWRSGRYNSDAPKEAKLLNLYCKRWEKSSYQIMVAVLISLGIAFLMYLFVKLGKGIAEVRAKDGAPSFAVAGLPNSGVQLLEIFIFFGLFAFKFRALWDARGAQHDLKESGL